MRNEGPRYVGLPCARPSQNVSGSLILEGHLNNPGSTLDLPVLSSKPRGRGRGRPRGRRISTRGNVNVNVVPRNDQATDDVSQQNNTGPENSQINPDPQHLNINVAPNPPPDVDID